jgi:tetratricopeptide (TPR) repeat protein
MTIAQSFAPRVWIWALGCGLAAVLLLPSTAGCLGSRSADDVRPSAAEKWFRRAQEDYQVANIDEARDSVRKALSIVPGDAEVRTLAASIALSRLEFDETIRLLKGVEGSEAAGLRGRAYWYKGDLERAADELEATLNDPDVHDEWAKAIAKLARQGSGREPFAVSGGLLAPVEMRPVSPVAPYFVVPVEIDGEKALALISTGTAEVVIDSATRDEPSWVSLRFAQRLEVYDVPALVEDLSGLSKDIGAPIRALLGVNFLRHMNATIDFTGRQFVVRSFSPPPPPHATRVNAYYARGGGMVVPSTVGSDKSRVALFVDSSMRFPIALDQAGWAKAGSSWEDLELVPNDPAQRLRTGVVSILRLGAYDVARVPGVYGAPIEDIEKGLHFDIDGVIGSALLAQYRITFADGGRLMWLEDETAVRLLLERAGGQPIGGVLPLEPAAAPPSGQGEAPANGAEPPPAKPGKAAPGKAAPGKAAPPGGEGPPK